MAPDYAFSAVLASVGLPASLRIHSVRAMCHIFLVLVKVGKLRDELEQAQDIQSTYRFNKLIFIFHLWYHGIGALDPDKGVGQILVLLQCDHTIYELIHYIFSRPRRRSCLLLISPSTHPEYWWQVQTVTLGQSFCTLVSVRPSGASHYLLYRCVELIGLYWIGAAEYVSLQAIASPGELGLADNCTLCPWVGTGSHSSSGWIVASLYHHCLLCFGLHVSWF